MGRCGKVERSDVVGHEAEVRASTFDVAQTVLVAQRSESMKHAAKEVKFDESDDDAESAKDVGESAAVHIVEG